MKKLILIVATSLFSMVLHADTFTYQKAKPVGGVFYISYTLMCKLSDDANSEYQPIHVTPDADTLVINTDDTFLNREGMYTYTCNMVSNATIDGGLTTVVSKPDNDITFTLFDGSLSVPVPLPPTVLSIQQ